jgi:hypothetical protein
MLEALPRYWRLLAQHALEHLRSSMVSFITKKNYTTIDNSGWIKLAYACLHLFGVSTWCWYYDRTPRPMTVQQQNQGLPVLLAELWKTAETCRNKPTPFLGLWHVIHYDSLFGSLFGAQLHPKNFHCTRHVSSPAWRSTEVTAGWVWARNMTTSEMESAVSAWNLYPYPRFTAALSRWQYPFSKAVQTCRLVVSSS